MKTATLDKAISDLTAPQQAAVEHVNGPLLVLAGPGSGKTRVVTRRIAHLIEQGIPQWQILALTFTNKAAQEMHNRIETMLPGTRVWVSTFHRFCARLLRQHAGIVGLQSNYTIYDVSDQRTALRRVMSGLDLDTTHYQPDKIAWRISNAKNDLITADIFAHKYEEAVGDHWQAVVAKVYPAYQKWLLESNAVDFDDLLLHVAQMLTEHPELRASLDDRFRYILVDEYQDTNAAQYQIVRALSHDLPNLCVTGDPDQSIYGWRGARIENILRFEADYPQAQVVRLEQNFRSTRTILRSADSLIVNNTRRKAKQLVTDNPEGEPVELLLCVDGRNESDIIAEQMREAVESGRRQWSDFAIFYRVNALSRELEMAFHRHDVPHQLASGYAFYDRAEVKDMIAYLRLIYNPSDRTAFLRVVNTPLRGLGKTSQARLVSWSIDEGLDFLDGCRRASEVPKLSKRAVTAFGAFAKLIDQFSLADAGSVADLMTNIIERTGYVRPWEGSHAESDVQKLANVQELVTAAAAFDVAAGDERSLEAFLEQTCLVNETDNLDTDAGKVSMMTLHAAKGLEFPVVYIIGVEHGLLPHERSLQDSSGRELEEERRLLFVGMTRAEEELRLTQTTVRAFRGRVLTTVPSEFTREADVVPVDLTERDEMTAGWKFEAPSPESPRLAKARERRSKVDFDAPKLTTGADLLNGTKKTAAIPQSFSSGMKVRHPRYGVGTVTATSGTGAKRAVTVTFDDGRQQTFRVSHCPLQPVASG